MKDNKNWVFALKATDKTASGDVNIGYLVFPDEKQAFDFLSYSNRIREGNPSLLEKDTTTYSAYNWVVVDKTEADRIHNTGMCLLEKVVDADADTLKQIQSITKVEY